jgi:hypothetical protein
MGKEVGAKPRFHLYFGLCIYGAMEAPCDKLRKNWDDGLNYTEEGKKIFASGD